MQFKFFIVLAALSAVAIANPLGGIDKRDCSNSVSSPYSSSVHISLTALVVAHCLLPQQLPQWVCWLQRRRCYHALLPGWSESIMNYMMPHNLRY
jgi:hypothetical protein